VFWDVLRHPLEAIESVTAGLVFIAAMTATSPNTPKWVPWVAAGIAAPAIIVGDAADATAAFVEKGIDKVNGAARDASAWIHTKTDGWKKVAKEDTDAFIAAAKKIVADSETKALSFSDWVKHEASGALAAMGNVWTKWTAKSTTPAPAIAPATAPPTAAAGHN